MQISKNNHSNMNNNHAHESKKNQWSDINNKHYLLLLLMAVLSFISMYALMYSMVDTFDNIYHSLNQVYMASLMTAPMVLIEVSLMRSMYRIKKLNILVIAVSIILLVASFAFIRQQTAIGDEQFLRSMISHHASAILMCEQASLQDPEIQELCNNIVLSQQAEIDQMKAMLNELPSK